jgi:TolA-binding protein
LETADMKFIQHLLSKGLIIAIVILAALGYHFRADLFPQWFKAPGSEEQSAQQSSPVDTPPDISPDVSPDVPPAPPPLAVVPAPEQESPAAPLETPPAFSEPMPAQTEQLPPPRYAPVDEPKAASAVPQAPASVAPQEDISIPSNDSADVAASPVETTASLDAARAAFWAQDFDQAEKLYQELASADPAAADALGELGNLYYTQGRWSDAAEAYAGAVPRLAAVGDIPRARHLLRVLDGLDPARAKAVWESISTGGG